MKSLLSPWMHMASFSVIILLSSCIGAIQGNGNIKKESREIGDFTEISISGAYKVYLRQGVKCQLEIEADDNLFDHIITKNEGERLTIFSDEPIHGSKAVALYITVDDIDEIDISGAVELHSKSMINTQKLSIDLSGAGELELELETGELDIDLSGGTETQLTGWAERASIDISGAGELKAIDLETDYLDISISGAGSATVFVNKELNAEISGAGSVEYKGNPSVSKDISGAGSISSID